MGAGPIVFCSIVVFVPMGLLCVAILLRNRRLEKQRMEVKSPFCPKCGYDLRGSPERCPECGEPNTKYDRAFWEQR